jgi:uncharacterized protein
MLLLFSFFSLIAGYISLWIKKSSWIQGFFCLASLLLAVASKELTSISFIPLTVLSILTLSLETGLSGLFRYLLVTANFLIAGALFFQFLPGFPRHFSFLGMPINYGKTFTGLLLLGWLINTLKSKDEWIEALKSSLPLAFCGVALFLLVTSIKPPSIGVEGLFIYLFVSVIPEEALLRGFVQKELFYFLNKDIKAQFLSVLISASLSCLFHLSWITDLPLLAFFFLSALIYSTIYQITKKVEGAILCHFLIYCFTSLG